MTLFVHGLVLTAATFAIMSLLILLLYLLLKILDQSFVWQLSLLVAILFAGIFLNEFVSTSRTFIEIWELK